MMLLTYPTLSTRRHCWRRKGQASVLYGPRYRTHNAIPCLLWTDPNGSTGPIWPSAKATPHDVWLPHSRRLNSSDSLPAGPRCETENWTLRTCLPCAGIFPELSAGAASPRALSWGRSLPVDFWFYFFLCFSLSKFDITLDSLYLRQIDRWIDI